MLIAWPQLLSKIFIIGYRRKSSRPTKMNWASRKCYVGSKKNIKPRQRKKLWNFSLLRSAFLLGTLTVVLAFIISMMKSNIITVIWRETISFWKICFRSKIVQIIVQIFGVFVAPMLGVFLVGLFAPRVRSRVREIFSGTLKRETFSFVCFRVCSLRWF